METIHKTSVNFGNALEQLQQEQHTEFKSFSRRRNYCGHVLVQQEFKVVLARF
jgi:hypothetical protein